MQTRRRTRSVRKAEMPRFHRGRRPGQPRTRRAQDGEEEMMLEDEEFSDIDLDEILDMDEDAFEPVDEDEVTECPPGCVPAVEVEDEVEEEENEGGEEDEGGEEEEEDETKEASVKGVFAALYSDKEIQTIDKNAEMAMYFHKDPQDPHYIVIANGKPIGEIHQADLNLDENNKALFSAEDFPKHVMASISELGLANCVDSLNMRYYGAKVTNAAAQGRADAIVTAKMASEIQTKLASLKSQLLDNVRLAMDASLKNVFLDNPLRDALRTRIAQLGAPDAVAVELIEDAMQAAGGKYFEAMLNQADEWLGFEKEALAQVEKTIRSARYASPAERGLEIDHAIPQAHNKVPMIQTAPRQAAVQPSEPDVGERALKSSLFRSSTIVRGTRR